MGIEDIFKEDKEFFEAFRVKFKEELLNLFRELEIKELSERNLNFILDTLFDGIFKFDSRRVKERLRELLWDFHKFNIPTKNVFSQLFLNLLKEYIDYLLKKEENGNGIKKVRRLAEVLDRYLDLIDEIFMEFIEQMEKEKSEEEVVNPREVEQILNILRKSSQSTVELLAFYKVFPVLCKTRVLRITDIALQVEKCPYKVFVPGEKVYIRLPGLKESAVAEIINVDREVMTLRPLRFVQNYPAKAVRVFPEKEIDVKIETPRGVLYGFLHYISFEEVGVIVSQPKEIRIGEKVRVKFKLPTGDVDTFATVAKIEPLNNAYLLSLELECDNRLEQVISRYVLKRQQEILRELKV
jgi:hypothetical protein